MFQDVGRGQGQGQVSELGSGLVFGAGVGVEFQILGPVGF